MLGPIAAGGGGRSSRSGTPGRTSLWAPSGLGGSARHPKCSNNLVVPTRFRSLPGPLVSLTLTPTGTTEPSPGRASSWGSEPEPREAWTHLLFLCALGMGAVNLAVALQRQSGSWHLAAVTCLCVSALCSVSVILPELWSVGSRTTKPSSEYVKESVETSQTHLSFMRLDLARWPHVCSWSGNCSHRPQL